MALFGERVRDLGTTHTDRAGELLGLVALYDRSAFRLLYQDTSQKILRVLVLILRNTKDADDALQDVYFRVWLHASHFDARKGAGMSWLVGVSRNLAFDRLRARRRVFSQQEILSKDIAIGYSLRIPYFGAETQLIAKEGARQIADCLGKLDPEKAAIIVDAYFIGLSGAKIAPEHNVPESTARSQLRRAVIKLKVSLSA